MTARNVLLIEDDDDIAGLLELHLRELGCEVSRCNNGLDGLNHALNGTDWSLTVLDLTLPDMDGLEICRRLRQQLTYAPILMLTARDGELERVCGLESGADDYMTKPFSVVEFVARVKAILRRVEQLAQRPSLQLRSLRCAGLQLDLDRREARREGAELDLTAKEFDLLAYLMQHPARVFSRAQLLDRVWGSTHETFEHTVNSHINRLRAKVEPDPATPRYIVTVWGVGYRFAAEQRQSC
jgi:DNA-binding response OmpR family regulator